MYSKSIRLSLIGVSILALLSGCDSSSSIPETKNDIVGFSLILISHTKHEECFNTNGDTLSRLDSAQNGEYLHKL